MSAPPKPKTQKETLDQVWWVLMGSNGDSMVSTVKLIRVDLNTVMEKMPVLATREELDAAIEAHEARDIERRETAIQTAKNRSMTAREWLTTIGTVGSFLWPILVGAWILFVNHGGVK